MFQIHNIRYKNILFIDNLRIPSGKLTIIVGESGSGKSTLIRLLNRIISADTGTILYQQKPISDFEPVHLRREVVMLPQTPVIYPGTIRDNLLAGIVFSQKPKPDDEALLKTLVDVSLKNGLEENPQKLSAGEKQRLSLARVLLMKPKAMLLDEPTSALDEANSQRILTFLSEYIVLQNSTCIMVTHAKSLAMRFAHKTIELSNGEILSIAQKEDK